MTKQTKITNEYKHQQELIDEYYSIQAPKYDEIYYTKNNSHEPYLNVSLAADSIIYHWESQFIHKGEKILELGFGTGNLLDAFQSTKKINPEHYLGYDIAKEMVNRAHQKHPQFTQKLMHGDTTTIKLSKRTYRTIISNFGPPSYWQDLEKEAKKMFTALNERGTICLGFYSHQVKNGLKYGEKSTTSKERKKGIHIHFYTAEELIQIFKTAGFSYITVKGINFDSTRQAYELYQATGKIYDENYWKQDIIQRDAYNRTTGKKEEEARHLFLFASKEPFELDELTLNDVTQAGLSVYTLPELPLQR